MKGFNVERLKSGSYRVRKQINGQMIRKTFDHRPTNAEMIKEFSQIVDETPVKGSFYSSAEKYIDSKCNVLSPTTIRGYKSMLKNLPDSFTMRKISQITQADIQSCVNDYAVEHSPKSTINAHGFIFAVLRFFRPTMIINTALPQKKPNMSYIPTKNDIMQILDASAGTRYHIPFQLGIMSLRLGEICALTLDDINTKESTLTVSKTLVKDSDNHYVLKECAKTDAGNRTIVISDKLIREIHENGEIYNGYPNNILKALHRYQSRLGIPRFRFHDLRHFYASFSHSIGVSDANIMANGGWRSDHIMKSVYRHETAKDTAQQRVIEALYNDNPKRSII